MKKDINSKIITSTPMIEPDFKSYVFKNSENRNYLNISLISIVIQIVFFKYWYPFASFINGDSYSYLISAHNNNNIDFYPIGYPKFLRLFSVFSHSDTLLVIFQYFFLQLSILSLLFTIFYFIKLHKITKKILLVIMVFNPVWLYVSNYISSDSLFLSLSIIWFNILLWINYRPSLRLIISNSILLFVLFTIRYNALYYPILCLIIYFHDKNNWFNKIIGSFITINLIGLFILFNREKYFEETGTHQFSAFTGWQIANNAMYAYKFVDNHDVIQVPSKFQKLDKIVRDYFDSTRNNINHPEEKWMASTVYMWTNKTPLRTYLHSIKNIKDDEYASFKDWASIAPFYNEYGKFIITHYPIHFLKFFILPNSVKYYSPPLEFLENYSTGVDSVKPIAQFWFNYRTNKIVSIFKDFKINILNFYPIYVGTINFSFFIMLISFIILNGAKLNPILNKAIFPVVCLWFLNMVFSIMASPISLRFQLFSNIILSCFTIVFLEFAICMLCRKDIMSLEEEKAPSYEDHQLCPESMPPKKMGQL